MELSLPTILGNIRRDSYADIYYHHPYVREFRETWPEDCLDCPAGLEAIRRIKAKRAEARVLALTMHDDEGYLRAVLEAGGTTFGNRRPRTGA